MNLIPSSAIAVVTVLFLVIWLFLAHMMSSRREDARLRFLLNLMENRPASADHPGTSQLCPPRQNAADTEITKVLCPAVDDVVSRGHEQCAQSLWQELPVLFAVAMRGRAM